MDYGHVNKYLPYRRPHSTKVTHSHFFGTSSTFPMTGSLLGPGGRGKLDFLGRLTLEKITKTTQRVARHRNWTGEGNMSKTQSKASL